VNPSPPHFRIWIRKDDAGPGLFALRFDIVDGRGTLVLPRTAGTAASPAVVTDSATGLTASELAKTRFLVIKDGETERHAFFLGPFSDDELGAVPEKDWADLLITKTRAGMCLVYVPGTPPQRPLRTTRKVTEWTPVPRADPQPPRELPEADGPLHVPEGRPPTERTAASRIAQLDQALAKCRRRTAQLTRRVAELERQIESMGGTVAPFEMDTRGD
jgi:hypothetical protein